MWRLCVCVCMCLLWQTDRQFRRDARSLSSSLINAEVWVIERRDQQTNKQAQKWVDRRREGVSCTASYSGGVCQLFVSAALQTHSNASVCVAQRLYVNVNKIFNFNLIECAGNNNRHNSDNIHNNKNNKSNNKIYKQQYYDLFTTTHWYPKFNLIICNNAKYIQI